MKYNVIEKFLSIDGEGPTAGEIATFIRFGGCNLCCSWCDTSYSISNTVKGESLSKEEIYEFIMKNGATNVTLTGGEPLIQDNIEELIYFLAQNSDLLIHIETNGSLPIDSFARVMHMENVSFIVDYKLGSSNMENKMYMKNYELLTSKDVCKFVVKTKEDLVKAKDIIDKYSLEEKCKVYLSPIMPVMNPQIIVEFMKQNKMNRVRLQVQLHKIIWDPEKRMV